MGAELLARTLELLAHGQAPRIPQDPALATYAPMLSKAEGELNFSRPARELDWLVRGADPWPGAFTYLEDQPLKLFAPTLVLDSQHGQPPGTILPADPANPDFMMLASGQGILGLG
jgi:methionyl-tRNA formyltransferase